MKNYMTMTALVLATILTVNAAQAVKPTDVLPDNQNSKVFKGVEVRKGTIAATISNSAQLNHLLLTNGSSSKIESLIKDQRPLCKGLWAVDLVAVQPIHLWINDDQRPGRTLIAAIILQDCPQLLTTGVRMSLEKTLVKAHPALKSEILKALQN